MDSKPATDSKEDPVTDEDECKVLTDIDEAKQALLFEKEGAANAEPDLEAQVDGEPKENISAAPKAPRVGRTYEERRNMRLKPLDNLRTTLICLLVIQNAITRAISTHPYAFQLEETAPKTLAVSTLLVGMGRMLLVPLLFFVSGLSSQYALALHSKSLFHFIARKTCKTILAVVAFQGTAWLSKHIRGEILEGGGKQVPYYATQAGLEALLNGPTFYVLAVLALDYIFFISFIAVAVITNGTSIMRFINTSRRYNIAKYTSFLMLEVWIILGAGGIGLSRLPGCVQNWIYITSSAELHFPFLYIIAFIAGKQYTKFVMDQFTARMARHFPAVLCTRLAISTLNLTALFHYFPDSIRAYLDLRTRPPLSFVVSPGGRRLNYSDCLYGMWAAYTLMVVPESLILVFYRTKMLSRSWGRFSRYSYIQVYVQMLIAFESGAYVPKYVENVLLRGLYIGTVSLGVGYVVALCVDKIRGWVAQGWNVLFPQVVV